MNDKIVLLAKTKSNIIEVLISRALTDIFYSKKRFKTIWWYERWNQKFKDFNSSNNKIDQYYLIVWNTEKIYQVKTWKLQKQNKENQCFYQNGHCVIVKNEAFSNSENLLDYY